MAEIKTTVKSQRDDVSSTVHPAHELDSEERFWRDLQPWLEKCGYLLRPRYHPGWVASWVGTKKKWYDCEDGHTGNTLVLDAIRVSDGTAVGLKQLEVGQEHGSNEIDIVLFFSSETLAKDTRNHCVPIYEVLQVPDNDNMRILVMPLLRDYNDPQIQTVGEAVEFFHQMFEGLYFMHENHIAHRDCHSLNIMMDPKPLYPIMYHPAEDDMKQDFSGRVKHLTRTAHPVKYYWIDFGLSRKYDPDGPPPLETDFISGDKTIPEFQGQDKAYDPFPVDVYCAANIIRKDFLQTYRGVEFMQSLISDMTQDDPRRRPSMDVVVTRFQEIRATLSRSTLRRRLVLHDEEGVISFLKGIRHMYRTVGYFLRRIPPVPTPST